MMHHVEAYQTLDGLRLKCRCGIVKAVESEKSARVQETEIGEFLAEHEAPAELEIFFWRFFADLLNDELAEAAA